MKLFFKPYLKTLSIEARRRLPHHILVIFIVWPFLTAIAAAKELQNNLYLPLSFKNSLLISLGGLVILIPDFIVIAGLVTTLSLLLFSTLAAKKQLIPRFFSSITEPGLVLLSMLFGTVIFYPAALNHPALASLNKLPVWQATALLGTPVLLASFYIAAPGARVRVFSIVLALGILSPVPVSMYRFHACHESGEKPLVLLGLDSLSDKDNLAPLKSWAAHNDGTYYLRAVTPGLYTNSVWTSILTMLPVHDHGASFICQPCPKMGEKENLVKKAEKDGYRTVAIFPDQTTDWVSIHAGFDEDRSGPLGWRQLATADVENASILLPVFRPLLPKLSHPGVPPNHLGTFSYSLDRELDEIFSCTSDKSRIFVASHLTYLHAPRFPSLFELSWPEYKRVIRSEVSSTRDRSFYWQDEDLPTDAIQLHEWKKQRLQTAVIGSIKRTKFLERGGGLLLFADHGDRAGLTMDNFCSECYYHVPLITFGLPSRDPNVPVSLIDAGSLLGIVPHMPPASPTVEYTTTYPYEWEIFSRTAHVRWDGSVDLDKNLLNTAFRRLRSFKPYQCPK
jgi:hypothetical protein